MSTNNYLKVTARHVSDGRSVVSTELFLFFDDRNAGDCDRTIDDAIRAQHAATKGRLTMAHIAAWRPLPNFPHVSAVMP